MSEKKAKILLVEDDPNLGGLLNEFLGIKGYDITYSENGEDAWIQFNSHSYDLCLLDVMMPKMDGFTLAKKIRSNNSTVPIIFLTAKSLKEDKIEGFKLGADDYISKPFSMEELEVRINAVLRRTMKEHVESPENTIHFEIGNYTFNFDTQILKSGEFEQRLTTKEANLLRLLCIHKGKMLERDIALKLVWGDDNYFTGRSMDVYITKLRKYLKHDERIEIVNIHGQGFKLMVHTGN